VRVFPRGPLTRQRSGSDGWRADDVAFATLSEVNTPSPSRSPALIQPQSSQQPHLLKHRPQSLHADEARARMQRVSLESSDLSKSLPQQPRKPGVSASGQAAVRAISDSSTSQLSKRLPVVPDTSSLSPSVMDLPSPQPSAVSTESSQPPSRKGSPRKVVRIMTMQSEPAFSQPQLEQEPTPYAASTQTVIAQSDLANREPMQCILPASFHGGRSTNTRDDRRTYSADKPRLPSAQQLDMKIWSDAQPWLSILSSDEDPHLLSQYNACDHLRAIFSASSLKSGKLRSAALRTFFRLLDATDARLLTKLAQCVLAVSEDIAYSPSTRMSSIICIRRFNAVVRL
jgi:hypothetical protein